MSNSKAPGTVEQPELVKAGCGVRYDPEQLSPEVGFDFSAARKLVQQGEVDDSSQAEPAP